MTDKKDSPNSATIVAQLDASRKGVKAKFCLRFRVASAVLTLLISAKSARNPRLGEAGRNGGKDGEMRGIR